VAWLSYSSLIPPNLFILLAMIGVLIAWRRKPFGLAVATAAIGLVYLAAMPVTAALLIRWAEAIAFDEPTLPSDKPPARLSCYPPMRGAALSPACPTQSGG
jgi:hypothetical protein